MNTCTRSGFIYSTFKSLDLSCTTRLFARFLNTDSRFATTTTMPGSRSSKRASAQYSPVCGVILTYKFPEGSVIRAHLDKYPTSLLADDPETRDACAQTIALQFSRRSFCSVGIENVARACITRLLTSRAPELPEKTVSRIVEHYQKIMWIFGAKKCGKAPLAALEADPHFSESQIFVLK